MGAQSPLPQTKELEGIKEAQKAAEAGSPTKVKMRNTGQMGAGITNKSNNSNRGTSIHGKSRASNYSGMTAKPMPFNAIRFLANHLKSIKEEQLDSEAMSQLGNEPMTPM